MSKLISGGGPRPGFGRKVCQGKERKRNHWAGWDQDRNGNLFLCFFSGFTAESLELLFDFSTGNVGTTWKGVDRQLYKGAQRYTEYGKRDPRLVEINLHRCRRGMCWTPEDWWVVRVAHTPVGTAHGADNAKHIARVLGRSAREVEEEMNRIHLRHRGMGQEDRLKIILDAIEDSAQAVWKRVVRVAIELERKHGYYRKNMRVGPVGFGIDYDDEE